VGCAQGQLLGESGRKSEPKRIIVDWILTGTLRSGENVKLRRDYCKAEAEPRTLRDSFPLPKFGRSFGSGDSEGFQNLARGPHFFSFHSDVFSAKGNPLPVNPKILGMAKAMSAEGIRSRTSGRKRKFVSPKGITTSTGNNGGFVERRGLDRRPHRLGKRGLWISPLQ
jgi:hypothetical protein